MPQLVPLTNDPSSIVRVVFEERDIVLQTKFNIRDEAEYWTLDIREAGQLLAGSIPLLLGADLLANRPGLSLGSLIMVNVDQTSEEARYETLGTEVIMIHLSEAEKEALQQAAAGGGIIFEGGGFSEGFDLEAFL